MMKNLKRNYFRKKQLKQKTLAVFNCVIGLLIMTFLCISLYVEGEENVTSRSNEQWESTMKEIYLQRQQDSIKLEQAKYSIRNLLIDEVHSYIKRYAPKSRMSSENIVDLSLEYDYDIPLLMSQAHLESHFGTYTGGTNSVFGVIRKKFNHPDDAVENYIILMKSRYIVERTPEEALSDGLTLEKGGGRYAEDPNYSVKISKIRNNIIDNYKIQQYKNRYDSIIEEFDSIKNNKITV